MIVVSVENLSFAKCVRVQYRLRVDQETEPELLAQAREIQESAPEHNAISFLFYRPDAADITKAASVVIDWAPGGIWKNADQKPTGDYSTHEFWIMPPLDPEKVEYYEVRG